MNEREKCKEVVSLWNRYICDKNVWKDGCCKRHHPDTVKAHREASAKFYEEREKQSPYYKLQEAQKRITELEAAIAGIVPFIAPELKKHEGVRAAIERAMAVANK